MTQDDLQNDRHRMVRLAMDLIERRGTEVSRVELASAAKISKSRIDSIFPEEIDLFDAILEDWYAPDIAIMEEVIESDLPIQRKFFEFFARRFSREQERFRKDPDSFALYLELGTARLEQVRGYIDLADHYMASILAEAMEAGYFKGLELDAIVSLVNTMMQPFCNPSLMMQMMHLATEDRLRAVIDTILEGLHAREGRKTGKPELYIAK